jgi:hypothetical protein
VQTVGEDVAAEHPADATTPAAIAQLQAEVEQLPATPFETARPAA